MKPKKHFNYIPYIKSLANFIADNITCRPFPKVKLTNRKQDGVFIRTGYYRPDINTIVLFIRDRHPKDVLRSFAHEMIHHCQNLENRLDMGRFSSDKTSEDSNLVPFEEEAYKNGNILFRNWTEKCQNDIVDAPSKHMHKKVNLDENVVRMLYEDTHKKTTWKQLLTESVMVDDVKVKFVNSESGNEVKPKLRDGYRFDLYRLMDNAEDCYCRYVEDKKNNRVIFYGNPPELRDLMVWGSVRDVSTIHDENEYLFESVEEATYPQSFDMEYFKSLNSFAARVRYCNEKLQRLGSGSSRIVYLIDDNTVLKLAKNKKGIAQNQLEAEAWHSMYGIFAEVYETEPNGLWIEMQRARKAKKSDFKNITGHTFEEFVKYVMAYHQCYTRHRGWIHYEEPNWDEYEDNEFFSDVQSFLGNTGLESVGDFVRISSWGVVNNNELVMVDYGLNDDVYETYYSRGRNAV